MRQDLLYIPCSTEPSERFGFELLCNMFQRFREQFISAFVCEVLMSAAFMLPQYSSNCMFDLLDESCLAWTEPFHE